MKIRTLVVVLVLTFTFGNFSMPTRVVAQQNSTQRALKICPFCGERFTSLDNHVYKIEIANKGDYWTCDNAVMKAAGSLVATGEACDVCPKEDEEPQPKSTVEGPVSASIQAGETNVVKTGALDGATTDTLMSRTSSVSFPVPAKQVCPYCGQTTFSHSVLLPIGINEDGTPVYWETCTVELGKAVQKLTAGSIKPGS